MTFGNNGYIFELVENWADPPADWQWAVVPCVATDSRDRVYLFTRTDNPLAVFEPDGTFVEARGAGVIHQPHGVWIDDEDNLYSIEAGNHCVHKFDPEGRLLMTLGTPGRPGPEDKPFNKPTDLVVGPDGDLFVSDGYGNARIHRFSPDGKLLNSWGAHGSGQGRFNTVHCVRMDGRGRLWVCDRENSRIQLFDVDGAFIEEWTDVMRPDGLFIDNEAEIAYVTEYCFRVSIRTFDNEILSSWGGGTESDRPGEFKGKPHGVWVDSRGDLYVTEVEVDGRFQKFRRRH